MAYEFDAAELLQLCAVGQKLQIAAGHALFHEGDRGDALYVVLRGQLRIVGGRRTVYEAVEVGGLVGEMAIVQEGYPRSAGVIAATECELLRVDRQIFLSLVAADPVFALKLMRVCCHRLRVMNRRHLRRPERDAPIVPAALLPASSG